MGRALAAAQCTVSLQSGADNLMPTGAELFVDTIQSLGIDQIFTLVGDHLNDVLPCAARRGIRILDMRHEAAVVHAADAWARIHRLPSLSLVTGGPGHTNSLTGIATAMLTGSPVITVSGSRPAALAERGAFQDVDQVALAKPIVKWAGQPPSAAQIPFYLARAAAEAMSGRSGTVHLTIPMEQFAAGVERAVPAAVLQERSPALPSTSDIDRAIELLRHAERPVVIAGSGLWWARAEDDLRKFAERTSLPVFTITLGRGALSDDHALAFGYADPALNRAAARAFAEADVFLVIGKRFDFRLAMGGPRVVPATAKVIQVDVHPAELGLNRRVDVAICADAGTTLRALTAAAGAHRWPWPSWLEHLQTLRAEWQDQLAAAAGANGSLIHPAALFFELRRVLPGNALYSWDGGDFTHWGRAILPARIPGGWLRLGPLATIGAALPNALALQLAHPGEPVVLFTGDGALGFYIAELDTAVRHNLPIVAIVGNDAGWGIERELQGGTGTVGCELRRTRYDVVMQGFGGEAEEIHTLEQVAPALERAFAARRPYLLNVHIRGSRSPFTSWKLEGETSAPAPNSA
jgi:acetolactate synthase-1/2/3 large subunit